MDVDEIPTLYRTWGGELWRALLSVSGGRSDLARDATSEAFARLVANAQSVREPRAWLYRTGYRVVVDELRRERRDRPAAASEAALDEYPSLPRGRLREA